MIATVCWEQVAFRRNAAVIDRHGAAEARRRYRPTAPCSQLALTSVKRALETPAYYSLQVCTVMSYLEAQGSPGFAK